MTPLTMIVGIEHKLHVHVHCTYYMYADECKKRFFIIIIVKLVMKKESLVRRGVDMDIKY